MAKKFPGLPGSEMVQCSWAARNNPLKCDGATVGGQILRKGWGALTVVRQETCSVSIRKEGLPPVVQGKESSCNAGDLGREDPLEESRGNPLQYSYLENPKDRETWWAESIGSQSVRHGWSDLAPTKACTIWREDDCWAGGGAVSLFNDCALNIWLEQSAPRRPQTSTLLMTVYGL